MFRKIFESSEETYHRKLCDAKISIREYKGIKATEKEVENNLYPG